MKLRIPHRDLDEPLTPTAITALTKTLDGEDRLVTREPLRRLTLAGARTMRDVVVGFEQLDAGERKALLRKLRRAVKREAPKEAKVIRKASAWSEWQACPAPGCNVIPVDPFTGAPQPVTVRRWWGNAHRHLAAAGDLEPYRSNVEMRWGGALVEVNEVEVEREQREAKLRQARHEEQLKVRALEAQRMAREQELRDAAFRAELPEAFR